MDLTKKEIDFINKSISEYWLEYNSDHEDNKEDWELTLNLVKKLTIPVVSQRSKLLKGFVDYIENEFDIYAYTPEVREHISNYLKTL